MRTKADVRRLLELTGPLSSSTRVFSPYLEVNQTLCEMAENYQNQTRTLVSTAIFLA